MIVGRIAPVADIREAPAFAGPVRTAEFFDSSGKLHGRVTWASDEAHSPEFEAALHGLYIAATLPDTTRSLPASAS
jgi:hypothetical protein